jgi:hypothetical protein
MKRGPLGHAFDLRMTKAGWLKVIGSPSRRLKEQASGERNGMIARVCRRSSASSR